MLSKEDMTAWRANTDAGNTSVDTYIINQLVRTY